MNGHSSYRPIAASYFKHGLQHKNPKPDPLNTQPDPMNRRDFLTASGLIAISAAAPAPSAATAQTSSAEGAGLESALNKALKVAKDAQSNASAVAEAVLVTSDGALELSPAKWLWYPGDRVLLNNSIEGFYGGSKRPDRVFGKGQLGARTLSLTLPPNAAGELVVHRDERLALKLIAPCRFALPVDQTVNIALKYF